MEICNVFSKSYLRLTLVLLGSVGIVCNVHACLGSDTFFCYETMLTINHGLLHSSTKYFLETIDVYSIFLSRLSRKYKMIFNAEFLLTAHHHNLPKIPTALMVCIML